jgi:hypothetical protein
MFISKSLDIFYIYLYIIINKNLLSTITQNRLVRARGNLREAMQRRARYPAVPKSASLNLPFSRKRAPTFGKKDYVKSEMSIIFPPRGNLSFRHQLFLIGSSRQLPRPITPNRLVRARGNLREAMQRRARYPAVENQGD